MKHSFFLLFMLGWVMPVFAQLNRYIYLQTDQQKPFYVRYEGRIISASAGGYMILSKLKDGNVKFSLGFPGGNQQESNFECTIERQDRGFLVKSFGDKGWGLLDLQSGSVIYALADLPQVTGTQEKKRTEVVVQPAVNDPFAEMLSKVTKDSTVKQVAVVREVEEKPISVVVEAPKPKPAADTVVKAVVIPPAVTVQPALEAVTPGQEPLWVAPQKSKPAIASMVRSAEGVDIVIRDVSGASVEMISLFIHQPLQVIVADSTVKAETSVDTLAVIPVDSPSAVVTPVKMDTVTIKEQPVQEPVARPAAEVKPAVQQVTEEEPVKAPVAVETTQSVRRSDTTLQAPQTVRKDTTVTVKVSKPVETVPSVTETVNRPKSVPNTNCRAEASEDDFIRLRRKMVNARSEELMVEEAKKAFRLKCYTVEQLNNLSFIFLSDEWRYRFFDAALPFVTDFSNFGSLENNIRDDYYKKRFRALLPNQ